MPANNNDLKLILQNGRESIDVEFKPWQDPTIDTGKAIIAKACMALRNVNGGFLVIGMQDDGTPDDRTPQPDVRAKFHQDKIQGIIGKFASESFPITVHFVEFGKSTRVVIEVPSGIRTPVLCKNHLPREDTDAGHKSGSLLQANVVYVRTLNSNHVVSSSIATLFDWPRLMEVCFNNREADIGAFMRRQLSGLDIDATTSALFDILKGAKGPTAQEVADKFLDVGYQKYVSRLKENRKRTPKVGTREVSAAISGRFEQPSLDEQYLWKFATTPRMSGWPPFIAFLNLSARIDDIRYDADGADVLTYDDQMFYILDFSRIESTGRFYYLDTLPGDFSPQHQSHQLMEFVQETARISEIIAVILLFAKTFCGAEADNQVSFTFRWRGLSNRRLGSPDRHFWSHGIATQDEFVKQVTIPVSIAISAIGPHVESIVKELFRLFGGHVFESSIIQQVVVDRLNRRL